jgi:hypothetical protein
VYQYPVPFVELVLGQQCVQQHDVHVNTSAESSLTLVLTLTQGNDVKHWET